MKKVIYKLFGYKKEYHFMSFIRYLQYAFFQRIIGINFNTHWPVHFSSMVSHPKNIKFSSEIIPLGYSPGCYIQARNGIIVGSNVIIASGVKIISSNHDIEDFNMYTKNKPIIIGNNCWIGVNAVILPEVTLADHTIVAAGAVVTKSFMEPNWIIGGVPARKLKKINDYTGENFYEK